MTNDRVGTALESFSAIERNDCGVSFFFLKKTQWA